MQISISPQPVVALIAGIAILIAPETFKLYRCHLSHCIWHFRTAPNVIGPKSNRRNIMKSSTRDEAEGKLHQVKGKIKEIAGKVILNPDLEAEGKKENKTGKVQEKIGEIKKVGGK